MSTGIIPRLRSTPTREQRVPIKALGRETPARLERRENCCHDDQSNVSPLRFDLQPKFRRQQTGHFSWGQVLASMALGASVAVILTALASLHASSTSARVDVIPWNFPITTGHLIPFGDLNAASLRDFEPKLRKTRAVDRVEKEDSPGPKLVWLMSFPNRYVAAIALFMLSSLMLACLINGVLLQWHVLHHSLNS